MGNAESTINHPTSLDATVSYLEHGKWEKLSTSAIHFEKSEGAALGCGGLVSFKKNVLSSSWTFKVTKTNSMNFEIGYTVKVGEAEGKEQAIAELSTKWGMSSSEVREITVLVETKINDDSSYSEIHVYVEYAGKRNATVDWKKNDLNLKFTKRWNERGDHLSVDISF